LNEPVNIAESCRRNKQISNIQDHSKAPEFTTLGELAATPNGENPRPITKLTFTEYFAHVLANRGFKGLFAKLTI
jgi:superfamily II helicase